MPFLRSLVPKLNVLDRSSYGAIGIFYLGCFRSGLATTRHRLFAETAGAWIEGLRQPNCTNPIYAASIG